MPNAILSVWRCIVRHGRKIPEPQIAADLRQVKRVMRNHRAYARRGHVQALFDVEYELRRVCMGDQSLADARGHFKSAAALHANKSRPAATIERNQETMVNRWKQHEARRFDEFNRPPRPGSSEWQAIDRRAKMGNTSAAFLHNQPSCMNRNPVVDTVFAPFWQKMHRDRYGRADLDLRARPRPVEIKSLNRVGGTLSLLRVRGIQAHGRGLRRHVDGVSRGTLDVLRAANFELWLAREYARDPLGDPDMNDWLEQLRTWKRHIEARHREQEMKYEVQRRIHIRRRTELERAWKWRFRRQQQIRNQRAARKPAESSLLRLNTL